MPWTEKQNKLFRAIEHGWKPPAGSGIHIKRKDATRMAHEGVRRAKGGLAQAGYDMNDTPPDGAFEPPRRGSPEGRIGGATRLYAPGGMVDPGPDVPSYQLGPGALPAGVQQLQWNQIDPFATGAAPTTMRRGGRVQYFDGGGQPNTNTDLGAFGRMAQYLNSLGSRPGSGARPTEAPPAHGGRIATISSDLEPFAEFGSSDPKYAQFDPRSRAIAVLNDRLKQQQDPSASRNASESIMSRRLGTHGIYGYTPLNYRNLNPFVRGSQDLTTQLLTQGSKFARGGYAAGGESGEAGGGGDLAMIAAAMAASRLRPRHINRLARPFSRALAKPVLGMESVSDRALSPQMSDLRYDNARAHASALMPDLPHGDLPVHRGQGAWMGEKGMEYNPLYMTELPRRLGRVRDDMDSMRYASQMGENLEQAATPVSRFVPHALNTPDEANAMMVHGVSDAKLRRLAEVLGPDVVTAHRPGNRAMVMPLGDQKLTDLETEINAALNFPKIRYGRSDPDMDRMLLARKPLGYESALYSDYGAQPRDQWYGQVEDDAMTRRGFRGLRPEPTFRGAK